MQAKNLIKSAAVRGLCALLVILAPRPSQGGWPDGGIALTSDDLDEGVPVLAPSGDGGGVVAWQQFGRTYAQRILGTGEVAPGWPAAQ